MREPTTQMIPPGSTETLPGVALSPWFTLCFVAIVIAGAILRLYDLDRRLMHGDEANQAIKSAILLETGVYEYDPHEHHGPTLYYFSYVVEKLLGHDSRIDMTEVSLRLVPATFGVATITALWLLRSALGAPATLFAALLVALSPALTFYSRYYIQETILAFFALAALIVVWRYFDKSTYGRAAIAGAAIALMFCTKETWILPASGIAIAVLALRPWRSEASAATRMFAAHAALAATVGALIWAAFFSSFFSNWRGLPDSFLAYAAYFDRGSAPAHHQHPWHFYLSRLAWHHPGPGPHWTEAIVLLAGLMGIVYSVINRHRFGIYLTSFTVVVLLGFSLISYKTPWNLIQFLLPLCILGGLGLGAVWSASKSTASRAALLAIATAGFAHLAWLNCAANFEYPEYPYNPYVYGHTSSAFSRLIDRIEVTAKAHPEDHEMLIAVVQPDGDYWPLPWYLRAHRRVGYWNAMPEPLPDAAVFILDAQTAAAVHDRLRGRYTIETHALRPRVLRTVYIKQDIR